MNVDADVMSGSDGGDGLVEQRSGAGLVVDPGSKVTYNGVEMGKVAGVDFVDVDGTGKAKLTLNVEPRYLGFIPRNVVADVRATTVFGNKYIAFSSPKEPSP